MKTIENDRHIFLVLVPHRDIRIKLKKFTASLIKNSLAVSKSSLAGVYNYPWVAPLAVLSQPFSIDELKKIARSLREDADGMKIPAGENQITIMDTDENLSLFGPCLDMKNFNALKTSAALLKIKAVLSPIVIGACLIQKAGEQQLSGLFASSPPQEELTFRAAAIANMFWKADCNGGFKWKIGKLCWLPKN